ncbi:LysR substrate-binding domain-containing protein [Brucella gallinifaecis]|nr:LysR substrate-binding domain-containing protein [Brucella gallinifaecis]
MIRPTLARLPPLTAMRAFVVSAKHLSFTAAADELHVTSAAIGQQVRLLEDHLGTPLFHRNRGQLELTDKGRQLAPGLSEAFITMIETIATLSEVDRPAVVRVSVSPSFASKWLVPRLDALRKAAPNVQVLLEATTQLVDLESEDIDCVIRYGADMTPDLVADPIFAEAIAPICSPDFARRYGLGCDTISLDDVPLIHESGPEHDKSCPDWNDWLRSEGMRIKNDEGGIRMNMSSLAIDAALAGHGLALGKLRLCEADLAAGRLVVPFGTPRPVGFSYYFATLPYKAKLSPVDLFRSWLRSQAIMLSDTGLSTPSQHGNAALHIGGLQPTSAIRPQLASPDL